MRFEDVLPALREGKKITDTVSVLKMVFSEEADGYSVMVIRDGLPYCAREFDGDDLMSDDWQVLD